MKIKIIRAIKARIIFVDILCDLVVGAPRRTRTLHNGSEDHCDIHFTMGAFLNRTES